MEVWEREDRGGGEGRGGERRGEERRGEERRERRGEERRGEERVRGEERRGKCTFGCVAGLVLAPVAEDFVFYPWHVFGVGFIVLLLGPLCHGCGCCS